MRNKALNLLIELDQLYADVVNGTKNIQDRLDKLLISISEFSENDLKDNIIGMVIINFNQKVNLISELCPQSQEIISLEGIRNEFKTLEIKQFEINNNYILGILKYSEIAEFQKLLFTFREQLYAIPISDNNLLEIAKMKSKIQHYETEILEDEDILKTAYQNSN